MPKAELHVHLEGTLAPETLWEMARRNHVPLPVGSLAELRALYTFKSFDSFIALWMTMCDCFRTKADYVHMVDGFISACRRQNILYAEAHFTPYNHEARGFGGRRALEVVTRRLRETQSASGPAIRLIIDIPSESMPTSGPYTAALLEEVSDPLIVAIGLGGPEQGYPRSAAVPYFERARRCGYAAVAHAGETGPAEHVRQAVIELRARRVQHGVHAVDDEETLRLLVERDVCCDVALTSNECLTVYRDLRSHPLRRLLAARVPVTLSTDDPPLFDTNLTREYERAHQEVGASVEELWQMNLNGLRYGLAEVTLRQALLASFMKDGESMGLPPSEPTALVHPG